MGLCSVSGGNAPVNGPSAGSHVEGQLTDSANSNYRPNAAIRCWMKRTLTAWSIVTYAYILVDQVAL